MNTRKAVFLAGLIGFVALGIAGCSAPQEMSVEEIYLRTVSRFPTKKERRKFASREEMEDFMWAMLNSKEFVYGH